MISYIDTTVASIQGRRPSQQDAALAVPVGDGWWAAGVFDGMGGADFGALASASGVTAFARHINEEGQNEQAPEPGVLCRRLMDACAAWFTTLRVGLFERMGTTATIVVARADRVAFAACGDSPIVLLRDRTVNLLFVPHTVGAEFRRNAGRAQPLNPTGRGDHVILNQLGGTPETGSFVPRKGDLLLAGSDGLGPAFPSLTTPFPRSATEWVERALKHGSNDNITCVSFNFV